MIRVTVPLAERSYDVAIGPGAKDELAGVVPPDAARAVVVTQERIGATVDPGLPHTVVHVPDGEAAKSLAEVERLCRAFAVAGLTRADLVVALGGGVVSDLAGFAAATFHRGLAYVNVPTTLLGQVDAAIGGKTAVNLPEGKNLVGAFWQPRAVFCDTDFLSTLPLREWSSGRGEMAKYAFLGDDPPGAGLLRLEVDGQVAACVALKASVVGADELDDGRRLLLNYGHTLAHALEAAGFAARGEDTLRHGEAVAVGLVFAAELAHRLGRIDTGRVALHREVVGGFDLPSELPAGLRAAELITFMARDKKARGALTFVLDGPGGVEVVRGVPEDEVVATLVAMGGAP